MHKHTVLVSKRLLNEYLDERRLTIGKAQSYLNKKESQRVSKQITQTLIFGVVVLFTVLILISI